MTEITTVPQRQAVRWQAAGAWPADAEIARVTLCYADRAKRRVLMTDDGGTPFLLNLPRTIRLSEGDGLLLEGGAVIRVAAATESLLEVTAPDETQLARLAWHIGNRHVPAEIVDGKCLRIAADSVLATMLRQLGADIRPVEAPFCPEGGAYAQLGVDIPHAH